MSTFALRLKLAIAAHSPLVRGHRSFCFATEKLRAAGYRGRRLEFGKRVLEAARFELSIIKPQSAFFERFGSAGFRAMEELVRLARARDVLVLLDGKRGDIDTTAEAYAEGYFSTSSPLRVDAVTTHAYLGFAALEKFLAIAIRNEGGVFVVVRSSNPEGAELQLAKMAQRRNRCGKPRASDYRAQPPRRR